MREIHALELGERAHGGRDCTAQRGVTDVVGGVQMLEVGQNLTQE